jgi:hypothetical protein
MIAYHVEYIILSLFIDTVDHDSTPELAGTTTQE